MSMSIVLIRFDGDILSSHLLTMGSQSEEDDRNQAKEDHGEKDHDEHRRVPGGDGSSDTGTNHEMRPWGSEVQREEREHTRTMTAHARWGVYVCVLHLILFVFLFAFASVFIEFRCFEK